MINIPKAAKIVAHINYEMGLHLEYCKGFGVTKDDVERTEESQGKYIP
jgi:thiaminase